MLGKTVRTLALRKLMTYQKPVNLVTPDTGRYYHPYRWPQDKGSNILPVVTSDLGVRFMILTPIHDLILFLFK